MRNALGAWIDLCGFLAQHSVLGRVNQIWKNNVTQATHPRRGFMEGHMNRKRIDPLTTDTFGAVLNCAVRYCIGRATYMPGLVTDWIMDNCHGKLNGKTLFVMGRDIDEAKSLGMDCDVKTWMKFREWIRQETEKNDAE